MTFLGTIFFVITSESPCFRKKNSGMHASHMFSVHTSGFRNNLHFLFTRRVGNSCLIFSYLLFSNIRNYASSQSSFLPFPFTYNFMDLSISLASELHTLSSFTCVCFIFALYSYINSVQSTHAHFQVLLLPPRRHHCDCLV
jgi:hypothetical protein